MDANKSMRRIQFFHILIQSTFDPCSGNKFYWVDCIIIIQLDIIQHGAVLVLTGCFSSCSISLPLSRRLSINTSSTLFTLLLVAE